ncbi:hypothetical protein [Halovenus salina]|uniref:Uncharacterized protein n=1 Tax=Halovenus salina TaxID=1510225 RepID=A0ABD5VYJ1_9EURY|nr:hypothetical protein [Halovenus salina]
MNERDGFDIVLVVLVAIALAREFFTGSSARTVTVEKFVDTATGMDPVYYLIVGGVFGVLFVSYITLYLPQKQGS